MDEFAGVLAVDEDPDFTEETVLGGVCGYANNDIDPNKTMLAMDLINKY